MSHLNSPFAVPFPPPPANRPGVINWFNAYCVLMCVIYVLAAAASLIFFLVDPVELKMEPLEAHITGMMLVIVGMVLMIAFILPFFVARRPWVWVYDLILICIGLTSFCFWPICIPLLIFWIKPETKAWYGR